jgi:hypothetical protein
MDQATEIVEWLGNNQATILAAIATLTAILPALVKLWVELKRATAALDHVTGTVEENEILEKSGKLTAPAKQIKLDLAAIEDAMPSGQKKRLAASVERARARWADLKAKAAKKKKGRR